MNGHATRHLPADHPTAAGHFPGNPIIPGAVLLQMIAGAVAEAHPGQTLAALSSAKFLHPVRPGETIDIAWTTTAAGDIRFTCAIAEGGPRAVTGVLRLGPP